MRVSSSILCAKSETFDSRTVKRSSILASMRSKLASLSAVVMFQMCKNENNDLFTHLMHYALMLR